VTTRAELAALIASNTGSVRETDTHHQMALSRLLKTGIAMAIRYNATASARGLTHFQFAQTDGAVTLMAIAETVINGNLGERREPLNSKKDPESMQLISRWN
jgi:hypothetical protein